MSLTEKIRAQGLRLGFDLVGVTGPEPPAHVDTYRNWVDAGRQAGMNYLAADAAIQRRADPRRILPSCRSIIVTGTNYAPQTRQASRTQDAPSVAAYALGEDYHAFLLERMQAFVDYLHAEAGQAFEYRIYTDTGPILERDLAQRAGLGWIGKNTCLIHPQRGSYLLLGEILLDLELDHDAPFDSDHCGTCTRCIQACPTGCILPDRTLDAGRCISYLTIEEKGEIPEALRPAVGDWLFGCDICQQVCPWNVRFAAGANDPAFRARTVLDPPRLEHFLQLQPGTWGKELKGSPLQRPRRRCLVRNACVAAGNSGRLDLIDHLARILTEDEEPLPRAHAAWALGQLGGQEALRALESADGSEPDPAVQRAISTARQLLRSSD